MTAKRTIIEQALDDISFSGDYDDRLLARGLRTMDQMVYEWLNQGLDIGYLLDDTSSLDDESGLLLQNLRVVRMGLACELADQLDIPVSPSYRSSFDRAYDSLYTVTPPVRVANPFMPVGAGNGCYRAPAFQHYKEDQNELLTSDAGISGVDDEGFIIDLGE